MAIEGQLSDVSLADICQLLAMGGKTGCLTVTDRSNFGYVYFEGGRVIYATVLNRPDRLGELLVRNNVIDRSELSAAMEAQAHHPGERLGRILVDRGSLTEEQLDRFITIQIEEAVYHLFTWSEGSFHFDPGQKPDQEGALLVSISAETLLLEGARRVDEMSLIQKKIPSTDIIFTVERLPTASDDVEITADQGKLLGLLDGARTVEDVIVESGLVEFDVVKGVYGLLQAGFVRRVGQREEADAGEESGPAQHLSLGDAFYRAGMMEDAEREYMSALEVDPWDRTARSRLGLIALKAGRAEDALEHFSRLEGADGGVGLLRNRALAFEQLRRYGEALAELDRAAELQPDDPQITLARGIVLLKNGDPVGSLEAFLQYREVSDDGEPEAMFYAYALLAAASAGQMDQALRIGREGLVNHPGNGPILVNLGVVLERRGEVDAAEALYLRAVREPPTPAQAHKNLGDMAYRRGDQAGARAHFERAVKLNPRLGDDLYLKLGNLAYKEGDRNWALDLWKKALELNPGNEVVRTNLELVSAGPAG